MGDVTEWKAFWKTVLGYALAYFLFAATFVGLLSVPSYLMRDSSEPSANTILEMAPFLGASVGFLAGWGLSVRWNVSGVRHMRMLLLGGIVGGAFFAIMIISGAAFADYLAGSASDGEAASILEMPFPFVAFCVFAAYIIVFWAYLIAPIIEGMYGKWF